MFWKSSLSPNIMRFYRKEAGDAGWPDGFTHPNVHAAKEELVAGLLNRVREFKVCHKLCPQRAELVSVTGEVLWRIEMTVDRGGFKTQACS